jgi:hypothetical protein
LYALQERIYLEAGRPLKDVTTQDSALLAMLAFHMRRINPRALTDNVAREVESSRFSGDWLILCEDARPADRAELKRMGFEFVCVSADHRVCRERRAIRQDINNREEEVIVYVDGDNAVTNNGSLEELTVAWTALLLPVFDSLTTPVSRSSDSQRETRLRRAS